MLEIKPLCVCEITEVLQLATSTVSKHLSILRDVDFIIDEKNGRWVNYRLNTVGNSEYLQLLLPLVKKLGIFRRGHSRRIRLKVNTVDRSKICGI